MGGGSKIAKLAIVGVLAILCVNLSIWLVNDYGLLPEYTMIPGTTPDEISGRIDINGTITPSPDINLQWYDVWGTMGKVWSLIGTSVLGVPFLLNQIGVPIAIQLVIDALYLVIVVLALLEFASGRGDLVD